MKFLLTLIAALLLATTADARTRDRQAQAQWQVQAQGQAQALAPEGPGDKHSGCSGRFVNRAGEWFKAHC